MSAPGADDPLRLLQVQGPWDHSCVQLLDHVVAMMYAGLESQRRVADEVLKQLRVMPETWRRVDQILELSQDANTKFFALTVLSDAISTRWKILPEEDRNGIKQYVVQLVIKISADEALAQSQRHFLTKLNETLLHIVKQEWPHQWESFVPDLCNASKNNQALCENNMRILCMLSEEIFDFGRSSMTSTKVQELKSRLTGHFQLIFELCMFIFQNHVQAPGSVKPSLNRATLDCLSRYLTWVPLGYIFETQLIPLLLQYFWDPVEYRLECIKCMSEIACLEGQEMSGQYLPQVVACFKGVVEKVTQLPKDLAGTFAQIPPAQRPFWDAFLTQLALLLSGFLKHKMFAMEQEKQCMLPALEYLCRLAEVQCADETFKICLDFWHIFAVRLYFDQKQPRALALQNAGAQAEESPLMLDITTATGGTVAVGASMGPLADLPGLGGPPAFAAAPTPQPISVEERLQAYAPILEGVRKVMILKMVKPPEVTIKENEDGEIVRPDEDDTEELALYRAMREVLVYLTNLDNMNMMSLMEAMLNQECLQDAQPWSPAKLNRLCWAVGSISGCSTEVEEKRFLVTVIKDLLSLCEMKRGKENKAVVASNIMYVVGQYPRFLKTHWKFLRTVVFKLFEFMHETFPGVQEMAVDTFLKISQKCRRKFVIHQPGEHRPFVEELMTHVVSDTSDLEPLHLCTYYEAVGYMISAAAAERQPPLVQKLLAAHTKRWAEIIALAEQNPATLQQPHQLKDISLILRLHERVTLPVGPGAAQQIQSIYQQVLHVYKHYSEHISAATQANGPGVMNLESVRMMRRVKRDVLRLVATLVKSTAEHAAEEATAAGSFAAPGPAQQAVTYVVQTFIPPLIAPVLEDYRGSIPQARDAEVLHLLEVVCSKMAMAIGADAPTVLTNVFDSTLDMIKGDFQSFPDHRVNFYNLLAAVNKHSFDSLITMPPASLRLYVDSLVWALKHEQPNVSEAGLDVLGEFIEKLLTKSQPAVYKSFFQEYFQSILRDILLVLTDTMHKSGFKGQVRILQLLLAAVEQGHLADVAPKADVMVFLRDLLTQTFPGRVSTAQVEAFILAAFAQVSNNPALSTLVRDFLISLKEFEAQDFAASAEERARAQQPLRAAVPGLVPDSATSALPDSMDDI